MNQLVFAPGVIEHYRRPMPRLAKRLLWLAVVVMAAIVWRLL